MSKLWDKIKDTAYIRREHSLTVPDHMNQRLSSRTYADMKRKFKRSMEYFTEKSFPEDCVFLAYRLSDRAYEMLTEYERENEIVDLDFVENEFPKPNGYALTDKLR